MDLQVVLRRLVPADLEREFFRIRRENELRQDWREKVGRVDIDLSLTNWVDIGAAAQLIIQIDGWADDRSQVVVLLPSQATRESDLSEHDRQLRVSASRFLNYILFREALTTLAARRRFKLTFMLDGSVVAKAPQQKDVYPNTYKRVLPLHWLGLPDGSNRELLAKQLTDALKNSGEGIRTPDAQALANVVLFELVQNVVEHSSSTPDTSEAALVCGFAHTDIASVAEHFPKEEQPFLYAAHGAQQPILEVIVADGGRGISQTLQEAYRAGPGLREGNLTRNGKALAHNVVRWAFDRWSSEKPVAARERGVRGLFRVDRLVAKYFGQVSVRTAQTLFVREHLAHAGPVERFNSAPQRFAHQFGTLVRIRMTGTTLPSMEHLVAGRAEPTATPALPQLVGRGQAKVLVAEHLEPSGFPEAFETEVLKAIADAKERPQSLFVTVPVEGAAPRSLEHALRFLCMHAHPVPIYAVNLRCSLGEFEVIEDAVNAECDQAAPQMDGAASRNEHLDLVMAVHESGVVRWIGLPPSLANVLGQARPGQTIEVPEESHDDVLRWKTRLAMFFAIESIRVDGRPNRIALRCTASLAPFMSTVEASLHDVLKQHEQRPQSEVAGKSVFLTPTLTYVDRWYRLDGLLDALQTRQASNLAFGLSLAILQSFRQEGDDAEPDLQGWMIYKEGRSSSHVEKLLRRNLNLLPYDTSGSSTPTGLHVGAKLAPVIVYTDVVRSGESLRRAAQTVLRQGFAVAAIVAMVDMRADADAEIVAFGQKFDLIRLLRIPSELQPSNRFSILAPSLARVERRDALAAEVVSEQEASFQSEGYMWSALQFEHQIRPSGRHLTLTLKPEALLQSPAFVAHLRESLQIEPLFSKSSKAGALIKVLSVVEGDQAWGRTVTELFDGLNLGVKFDVQILRRVSVGASQEIVGLDTVGQNIAKSELVIVFDWGVISGKTIDAIANEAVNLGARRVLVLVGNSQVAGPEFTFRNSVREVARGVHKQRVAGGDFETVEEPVEYRFLALSRLPLGHYSESDCPVCKQVDDLLQVRCSDQFLAVYSDTATKELISPPPGNGQLLAVKSVRWMELLATFRALLVASQYSTAARFAFAEKIDREAKQADGARELSPGAHALIELLYVEGHWIQLAPVRYRRCKSSIKTILLNAIKLTGDNVQPKAISVLRRLSKTDFIAVAPSIFKKLKGRPNAQKALLLGIHTYLAKRYHHTLGMLKPAIVALQELDACATADGQKQSPSFAAAYSTIKHLNFQANFLQSRTEYSQLDILGAVSELVSQLSEPKYYAHGLQNQAIEYLFSNAYRLDLQEYLQNELAGEYVDYSSNVELRNMIPGLFEHWDELNTFLVATIIPLAVSARPIFESRDFEVFVDEPRARWFRSLLDSHQEGMAPELVSSQFLKELQRLMDGAEDRLPAREMLELLTAFEEELACLYELLLRAQRKPGTGGRPGADPGKVRLYLDASRADPIFALQAAIQHCEREEHVTVEVQGIDEFRGREIKVFCRRKVLQEAIREILRNAGQHGIRETDGTVHVAISCALEDDCFVISASNRANQRAHDEMPTDGTAQRHGIGLFKNALAPFQGDLEVVDSMDHFNADIRLRRW